ncbi:MAG: hypothetical protein KIT37_10405 [Steroidobacteraceae bacterium]|nr:hypothetical protein [Steroidobacteraceae bacterium]
MMAAVLLLALVSLNGWCGWRQYKRSARVTVLALPAAISLLAAWFMPAPAPGRWIGGLWVFAICLVVSAGLSLAAFCIAFRLRSALASD